MTYRTNMPTGNPSRYDILLEVAEEVENSPDSIIESTNPKDLIGCKKPQISLVPPAAIIYMAEGFRNGALKYGPYNWRKNKVRASIYVDAAMRHLLSWFDGEEDASDSKLSHLAHALDSIAILVDAKETGNLVDDRPIAGRTAALIDEFQEKNK